MKTIVGIPASPGIVVAKTFLYMEESLHEIPHYTIQKNATQSEWERFLKAREEAVFDLRALCRQTYQEIPEDQAGILDAHILMLEDPDFHDQIEARLNTNLENIEWAVFAVSHDIKDRILASSDPYLRERAADVSDVASRLIRKLLSVKRVSLADLESDVILVSHDLLPSDVLAMNKKRVKGIVTDSGSRTSHTAILARAFDIPAVLGLSSITREIKEGETLVVNGVSGEVIVNPSKAALAHYRKAASRHRRNASLLRGLRDLPAETLDGRRVSLKANIEVPEEVLPALRCGAEGIGLYRSEFLFLTPGQITGEEEQYQAYRRVLRGMGNLPVTIRTLDIGGDKLLPEPPFFDEKNPLLGWRAIRLSLARPELFKTQLRALLRAAAEGNLSVMFPMISGLEEFEQALAILDEAKSECRQQGQIYAESFAVGAMIEIPAAAMIADILAERADFFSIGTNDLIQYTLAVDRGNEKVGHLAQPSHPAVLRLLKRIIDCAHGQGIPAAMCGELAGDPSATALLLGLGLDEFSMTAQSIPAVKQIIRKVDMESCRSLTKEALACASSQQVSLLIETWMADHFPQGYFNPSAAERLLTF
ncbi:MAG: phosphoenolpyruvate--protein phosphotransferase [Spirochaetaceae bacterium]|jgi:phosphotransferase system enzyme I (PtsI)|nr:phosphoenolpyruvate--protein phosphotransferase [Spirochaetaceae bacterium]